MYVQFFRANCNYLLSMVVQNSSRLGCCVNPKYCFSEERTFLFLLLKRTREREREREKRADFVHIHERENDKERKKERERERREVFKTHSKASEVKNGINAQYIKTQRREKEREQK